MGIVMPRIRIMQAMMAHGCRFQYFAEIHDDMSFFQPGWLSKLLAYDEPQVAILMPFIVLDAGGNDVHTTQRAMALAEARISGIDPEKNNTLYYDCIANHPWILKRSLIRTVGYYDSDYLWHEVEDNDFYYRVRKAGFHGLAIRVCRHQC
jgi:GT2 family glycosyltransferase